MHYRPRLGRRFWRMWTATGISSIGDGMVYVGFPLLALHFTHSAVAVAGVAVVAQAPALLVALPAGTLADRLNRRRMLVAVELLRFVVLGVFSGLVLAGKDSLLALYVTSFLLGTFRFAYQAAAQATLPDLVNEELLVKANSRLASVNLSGEDVAGQAVGGFAFAASRFLPFAADALSFLLSAALLRTAVPDKKPVPAEPTSILSDLRFGLRWFLKNPLLRMLAGLISAFAFCQALVFALLVLYATRDLHVSGGTYGLLLSVSAVASVVGATAAPQLHDRLGSAWCIILAGVAAGASYSIMAATGSPVVATAALALESMGVMVGTVASVSLRQATTPAHLQGRVASADRTVVYGVLPLGALVGGLLAAWVGIRTSFYVASGIQGAAILLTAPRLIARVRQATRPSAAAEPLRADLVGAGGAGGAQGELIVAGRTVESVLELPSTGNRAHEGGGETGNGGGAKGLGSVAEHP